jgi:hypothetical protein
MQHGSKPSGSREVRGTDIFSALNTCSRPRANDCRRNGSGSTRLGRWTGVLTRGVTRRPRNGEGKASSAGLARPRMRGHARWEVIRRGRAHLACRIWRETSRNGPQTSTPRIMAHGLWAPRAPCAEGAGSSRTRRKSARRAVTRVSLWSSMISLGFAAPASVLSQRKSFQVSPGRALRPGLLTARNRPPRAVALSGTRTRVAEAC